MNRWSEGVQRKVLDSTCCGKSVALSDCIGENGETDTAFDFARDCCYISKEVHTWLTSLNS